MIPASSYSLETSIAFGNQRGAVPSPRNIARGERAEVSALTLWLRGILVAAAIVGLAQVRIRLRATELSYNGHATRQAIQILELEEKVLQAEVELLSSPQRLESVALIRLGMRRPASGQQVTLP